MDILHIRAHSLYHLFTKILPLLHTHNTQLRICFLLVIEQRIRSLYCVGRHPQFSNKKSTSCVILVLLQFERRVRIFEISAYLIQYFW